MSPASPPSAVHPQPSAFAEQQLRLRRSRIRRTSSGVAMSDDDDGAGGMLQFIACIAKHVHQKRRDVTATLLEFGLPILFIIGTIILWSVFESTTRPGAQFISYDSPGRAASPSTSFDLFHASVCVNITENPAGVEGIANCGVVTAPRTLRCFATDPTVPVAGLCVINDPATPQLVPERYLSGIVYGLSTSLLYPLRMDDMILTQWITRLTIADTEQFYTPISALSTSGKLYFAPDNADTAGLVNYLNTSSSLFRYVYGGTLIDAATAEATVVNPANEGKVWGIVQVNTLTSTAFNVEIRLNHTALPETKYVINRFYLGGVNNANTLYFLSGFYTLQWMISKYFTDTVANVGFSVDPPYVVPMGFASYDPQSFLSFGGSIIPLLVVLGFLYPVSQLARRIVQEKELRIREAMQIMGLRNASFYGAWLLVYTVQHLITAIIITIILKHTYLTRCDSGILFFTFFFFELSTITMSGLISSIFSKARIAAIVTPLLYFATSIPLFATQDATSSSKTQMLILSPTAFAIGIQLLFQRELGGGMDATAATGSEDSPNMISVLFMLAVDTIIYFLLWLYIDAIMPNDWGTPRSCCYCIVDPIVAAWRYLRGLCSSAASSPVGVYNTDALPDGRAVNGTFEDPVIDERTTVQLVGLRKEYERAGKKFVAVNNLYWHMQEGQISVLLGHNGAGKTTTMNMMTGMVRADAGDCFIYGYSVQNELDMVRREIGYCPQSNVLWPELTCAEHLRFYGKIKGVTGEALEAAVISTLEAVDLLDKKDYPSQALSGGQKRKLSVAIAFVGGSRLVFLDEPTAGMDVAARRHTWDLLRRMASSHTILLTTHFMDEADLLGHQIGIMSNGSLQCSGSSLFLKSRLGVGYNIVLGVEAHVDEAVVSREIFARVADAELLSSGPGEITYRLPTHSVGSFPELLHMLETRGPSFGVRNFSISATTLEEIFLQIAHGEQREQAAHAAEHSAHTTFTEGNQLLANDANDAIELRRHEKATGTLRVDVPSDKVNTAEVASVWSVQKLDDDSAAMFASQLHATLYKRFKNSLRDRRTQCLQIVTPVLCILLAMLFTLIKIFDNPPLSISSTVYNDNTCQINLVGCSGLMNVNMPISGANPVVPFPATIVNSLNLSNYLYTNANYHGGVKRYSAIACQDSELAAAVGAAAASVVFYNTSTFHELPIGVFNYFNQIYRTVKGSTESMVLTARGMPQTPREAALTNSIQSMLIGIIIMIPFTFIPSTFVAWIVKERECKARHLQSVSGLKFTVYWLSNFIFDMLSFSITVALALIVFAIFDRTEYIGAEPIGATIVLFLLYGLTGVSFAYAISFLFEEHSTAQNVVMLGNFIAGFLLVLVVFILNLVPSTQDAAKVLSYIFRLIPSYCLGDGIINLSLLQLKQAFGTTDTVWTLEVCGADIIYMAVEFPFVMLLTLFIDHPKRRNRTQALLHDPDAPAEPIEGEEDDVAKERAEVESGSRANDLVVVKNMRKKYSNGKVAIKNLSFGVHPGEVFGFLGTNGAGKTTTISILCQEFFPTSGRGSIASYDIVESSEEALRRIGYCPQFDALLDLLTVEEHLNLYAGIRGILAADRKRVVEELAQLCQLTQYATVLSSELSGGNRRKLSVALSLLGGPSVVFLDEPSAGMDPMARRGLWTAIETVADNCAVVLCTHHLEEVEALAQRVAIMVDGTLRCIGDKLHLKTKYGSGFELSLRIADESYKPLVEEFFRTSLSSAVLNEYRSLRFTYALPQDTKLSEMFALLQKHKEDLHVTDYSISQTSIEQVFLRISAQAEEESAA